MKNSRRSTAHPAFTLIEVLIVTIIVALLSVMLALSFSGARNRATFGDHKTQIIAIMQQARNMSLSNLLIDKDGDGTEDTATYYYLLSITNGGVALTAYTEGGGASVEIESFNFDDGFEIADSEEAEIYYFPPYGDICFDSYNCLGLNTEKNFTLSSPEGQEVTINISAQGGYPEVVE